jgi:hypothetical protein
MTLAFVVLSIIHFGACIWFYIGSQYAVSFLRFVIGANIKENSLSQDTHFFFMVVPLGQRWYPEHAISWYEVGDELRSISYTEHNKFGMKAGATVWEQYLASFYWVAATITINGLSCHHSLYCNVSNRLTWYITG